MSKPSLPKRGPVSARTAASLADPEKVVVVLSVSPSEEHHGALREVFLHTNWTLLQCAGCAEAMEVLQQHAIPVVICDSALPDGSWKDILGKLKALRRPPALILAARLADDRLWSEVLHLGGYDVLEKPFDHHELIRVVSLAWLDWKSQPHRQPLLAAGG